jgi:heat shock protein HtpX
VAGPNFAAFPNLYEQQKRNRRRTVLVIALFILFLGFLGFGFDLYFFGHDPFGFFGEPYGYPIASIAALGLGGISAAWGLSGGAKAVLASAHAYPAPAGDPRFQVLNNVVDEMAIAAGIPRPAVYVIPDTDPNAFATGSDPQHSAIAVTEGLLGTLNREELQGVVAHELSHIRNYDIRLTTIVAALVGAAFLLSDWAMRGMRFGLIGGGGRGKSRSRGSAGGAIGLAVMIFWLVTMILAPILSQLLAMSVSRQREYLADASGAELTRNPLGLASALTKLQNAEAPTASIKKGSAHLCIVDPLGKKVNFREGAVAELFGTHPPIEKRITILRAMAHSIAPRPAGG